MVDNLNRHIASSAAAVHELSLMAPSRNVNLPGLAPFECWLTIFPDYWQKYIPADSLTMMLAVSVPYIHISCRLIANYWDYEVVLCVERVAGERLGTKHL